MAYRWKVFTLVSVGVFMSSLDLFIVNIAFPDLQRDFSGTSLAGLSWVLSAYAIVFAALLVPAGRIADRVGRRRAFLGGLAAFTVASALCAVAPSVPSLVAARVLQAAGGAFILPTSLGLLLPEFPPERRATAVGLWGAVGGVAAALGPPIGGLLVEASWRWVFLVNLPVGLIGLWAASRTLREVGESRDSLRPDLAGAVMFAVAIGLLALGIVQGRDWGWGSPEIVGSFVASALLVLAFGWRSARHPAPVIEPAILRVRSFAVANLATALFFAAFGAMLLTNVTFLTEVWGYSTLTAGLALAPGPVMAAIFSVPAGRLSDRFGQRAVAIPGGLLCAAGFVWVIWQVGPTPAYAADFLPGWLVGGAGVGLSISTLASAAAASLPPERFATGTGVFGMSRQIGTALGIAVTVAILAGASASNPMAAFDSAWTFMALTTFAVAVTAVALGRVRVAVPIARAEAPAEARA
jgi:EmrB/QacA subfamily drug resistance transporter